MRAGTEALSRTEKKAGAAAEALGEAEEAR